MLTTNLSWVTCEESLTRKGGILVRNKFMVFLSTLVGVIFLVAAAPAVADACSIDGGSCEPVELDPSGQCVEEEADPEEENGTCEEVPSFKRPTTRPVEVEPVYPPSMTCAESRLCFSCRDVCPD